MPVTHGEVHVQNRTGGVTQPFQDIPVGQILLGTVTGKEVPEAMQLVLPQIWKAALPARVLEVRQKLLLRDLLAIGHREKQLRLSWQGLKDRLTHHVHILEIVGDSYRLKSSLDKGKNKQE